MRELKFRGKPGPNQDWVYGFVIKKCTEYKILIHDWEEHPELDGDPIEDLSFEVFVIPETVGQYTGLKDKNGKEIYEGDIVKMHRFTQELGENLGVKEGEIETVCRIGIGIMGVMVNDEPLFLYYNEYFDDIPESFEVIGNIHDNSELLDA